jgi:ankyrin repeat protein
LATLRHLFALPSLREVAIKASRLKSLATFAIEAAPTRCHPSRAGAVSASVLQVLREAGVDITMAGSLDEDITPLITAVRNACLEAAQVLLDAGADVNGLTTNLGTWPLFAAVVTRSDAGMAWLLEHGASLTVVDGDRQTIAHLLAAAEARCSAANVSAAAEFVSRWFRRVIAAEPALLEARDGEGLTPLIAAAGAGCEAGVAVLLKLGANVGAIATAGRTALAYACSSMSLPVVRQLMAAGAASAAVMPPATPQSRAVAGMAVMVAFLGSERSCGRCAACRGRVRGGNCADGLDILRAVLAAGVREAVDPEGRSLAILCVGWMRHKHKRISAEYALKLLQTLHAAGVDVLARGAASTQPILNVAAEANAAAVVRWLYQAGAPLEARDSGGYTPLLAACRSDNWDAALALLVAGARVDIAGLIDGRLQTRSGPAEALPAGTAE